MPLVKRGNPTSPTVRTAPEDVSADMAALAHADSDVRWNAARVLGGRAEAVAALAAALRGEEVPRVREAIMTALMRIGDDASVMALVPYIRSQDAGVRSSAIEALQTLPDATRPFLIRLLQDDDTDVRILASELARNLKAHDATNILCELLKHEQHPNVCAAAIDVLAEVGTPDAVPALRVCAERFSETPFLPFAVSLAIARITGSEG